MREAQSDVTIEDINIQLEDARAIIREADALERLFNNPDFNMVIREGYFKNEPARLVEMKATPAMSSEASQTAILKQIDGIGALQQYFNARFLTGDMARDAIFDGEAQIDEISEESY
tara:strand:+ start:2871 stop:3221 length:351 start_codon:yes stop_codon:yes gene_type:complete